MENNLPNNLPVISRRIWSIVRIVYFMLRKGITKGKLIMDFNMMMKRGKIASKAMINNLMFHHHHHHGADAHLSFPAGAREYEFSCSNTPANYNFFPAITKRGRYTHNHFFTCAQAPSTLDDDVVSAKEVQAALEMLSNREVINMIEASPALPGFGRTPMVRQLRITDSPFPLNDTDEDSHVDEEAEKFIRRFYKELRSQKS